MPGITNAAFVTCGYYDTFVGLKNNQGVVAFGVNSRDGFSLGNKLPRYSPTQVYASLSGVVDVRGGSDGAVCVFVDTGRVHCAGSNEYGQLGNGNRDDDSDKITSLVPVQVLPKVVAAATPKPSKAPTVKPTKRPTKNPTVKPTKKVTSKPTKKPTAQPTKKSG